MPQLGPYTLHALQTGHFGLDGGAMFGIVPKSLWARHITPDAQNRIPMGMRALLLIGEGRVILVDTGVGNKFSAKFGAIYNIDFSRAELHRSLKAVGVAAADVTDVILTHLHFDHCGGGTRREGDHAVPAFPNAQYHVQKAHWDWAQASNPREQASFLAENLDPLAASGQLHLIDGPGRWAEGIELLTVDGHTHAQQLVKVTAGDRTLVYVADLIPTAVHIPPVWGMAYDIDPLKTIDEKSEFLAMAVTHQWDLFLEHDAHTEVIRVEQTERGFRGSHPRPLEDL